MPFLKPGEGRTMFQQDGQPWPAEGMDAPDTLFVRRRLRDLDLVEAELPAEEPPPSDPPATELQTEEPATGKGKGAK